MAYRVNGEEIFRDSSRDYEYNPVSDRWVDNGVSVRTTPSYSDDVLRTMEETERKEKEQKDIEQRIKEREERRKNEMEQWMLYGEEELETQREKERRKREIEIQKERSEAYRRACKRYREKSPFYRLLHKRPSKYIWQNMQPEQLDSLYQGRTK